MTDSNSTTQEEFRTVKTFPDYSVSNFGRVRRDAPTHESLGGYFLRQHRSTSKYFFVRLYDREARVGRYASVHRLVALAFLDNPSGYPQVNHKDGIPTNNVVTNLEWCTPKQNSVHSAKMGLVVHGAQCHTARLTEADVLEVRKQYSLGTNVLDLAQRYGVTRGNIYRVGQGKTWRHVRSTESPRVYRREWVDLVAEVQVKKEAA